MGKGNAANEFREIIDSARKRKQAEALAQELLGSNRRASAPGSLESRIGGPGRSQNIGGVRSGRVGKAAKPRSNLNPATTAPRTTAPRATAPRATAPRATARRAHLQNLYDDAVMSDGDAYSDVAKVRAPSNAIQVKGMGSPHTVIASNFAYGTTAADIESVLLSPENGIGGLLRCRLLSAAPTVIAELTFSERSNAERVVNLFNNKSADNHILHVYFKNERQNPPKPVARASNIPTGPRRNVVQADSMDLDGTPPKGPRTRAENARRAPVEYQDGRYGFQEEATSSQDNRRGGRGYGRGSAGLRSDAVMSGGQGFR